MDRRRAVTWAGVSTMVGGAAGCALVAVFGMLGPAPEEARRPALAQPPGAGTRHQQSPVLDSSVPVQQASGALDTPGRWPRTVPVRFSAPPPGDPPPVADTPLAAAPAVPSPRAQPVPVHEAPPPPSGPSGDTGPDPVPPTRQEEPPPPTDPAAGTEGAPAQPDDGQPQGSPHPDAAHGQRPPRAEPRRGTGTAPQAEHARHDG